MRSNTTFSDEQLILSQIEGAIYLDELMDPPIGRPGFAPLRGNPLTDGSELPLSDSPGLADPFLGEPIPGLPVVSAPIPVGDLAKLKEGAIEELLADELGIDVISILEKVRTRPDSEKIVETAVSEFGTDAFATYLPWHMYARSHRTPWGIYMFLEPLVEWAADMQRRSAKFGLAMTDSQVLRLAFYVCYRHELFHFHVESFCIRQEVLTARPIYLPYDRNVFQATANTDDWLEEALAQTVVLESSMVSRKLGLPKKAYREFMEAEFDRFGPGYRQYRCSSIGGPERGHKLLAAQIMSASTSPTMHVTKSYTPKREYGAGSKKVPGYIAWNPSFTSQFQLATPSKKKVYAYLKETGFEYIGPGPGDHERWRFGSQTIHVNFHGKECDLATLKDIGRLLGKTVREVIDEMNDRRRNAVPVNA